MRIHGTKCRDQSHLRQLIALSAVAILAVISGCGGKSIPGPQNANATLLLTSTANDKLTSFQMFINTLTLTSKSGNMVTLVANPQQSENIELNGATTPQNVEFALLNGATEPLVTMSIPQDTYTSAIATIGGAEFTTFSRNPSAPGPAEDVYVYGQVPDANVTVNLPEPITVGSESTGLLLNLQVSQSASWTAPQAAFTITPTFSLTPVTLSATPTTPWNGRFTGLQGTVEALSNGSITVLSSDGPSSEILDNGATVNSTGIQWQLTASATTTYQGISGLSALAVGMPLVFDANLQADGTLAATRIEVADTNLKDLGVTLGPITAVFDRSLPESIAPLPVSSGIVCEGLLDYLPGSATPIRRCGDDVIANQATYTISGSLANLQDLPFQASFSDRNMVAGQNVTFTSHTGTITDYGYPATTAMLMPQTLNGTVSGIAAGGNFTVYTLALASYDLFPQLAFTNEYQTSPLTSPGTVYVYADTNTQMPATNPVAVGGEYRMNGLVFNDNGTLRMDCAWVQDGVAE